MIYPTEGIVFSFIRYKETSIICKIYTNEFGLKSYIVNGIRSSKNSKIAFFQPLTLLNLMVYNKPGVALNRISEMRCPEPFHELNRAPLKIMLALFISEILQKAIKEEEPNPELFEFLKKSLKTLDELKQQVSNFHLLFLFQLSGYLGFKPFSADQMIDFCEVNQFNLEDKGLLTELMEADLSSFIPMENYTRKKILQLILKFYSLNIENLGIIHSANVLSEVFSK